MDVLGKFPGLVVDGGIGRSEASGVNKTTLDVERSGGLGPVPGFPGTGSAGIYEVIPDNPTHSEYGDDLFVDDASNNKGVQAETLGTSKVKLLPNKISPMINVQLPGREYVLRPGREYVQPPGREYLQPIHAQTLAKESDQRAHGWYGNIINTLGSSIGIMGAIPCCVICPNPYRPVSQGNVGLVTKFGRFYGSFDPGLVQRKDYSMNLQVMTREKLQFLLPVIFTVGPDVNQGDPIAGQASREVSDIEHASEARGDALMKYAMLLADGETSRKDASRKQHIENVVKDIIEGKTRVLVSSMTTEEIFTEREAFKKKILSNIQSELDHFGLKLYNADIKEVGDAPGSNYFESLSRKAHESAVNQARIDVAEAQRKGNVGDGQRQGEQNRELAKFNAETDGSESYTERWRELGHQLWTQMRSPLHALRERALKGFKEATIITGGTSDRELIETKSLSMKGFLKKHDEYDLYSYDAMVNVKEGIPPLFNKAETKAWKALQLPFVGNSSWVPNEVLQMKDDHSCGIRDWKTFKEDALFETNLEKSTEQQFMDGLIFKWEMKLVPAWMGGGRKISMTLKCMV